MTFLSLQPTLLATLALSLMNTLPSPTKSLHFLNHATITFVNFTVSAHISISKQPASLPPSLSILNLITVTPPVRRLYMCRFTSSKPTPELLCKVLSVTDVVRRSCTDSDHVVAPYELYYLLFNTVPIPGASHCSFFLFCAL